MRIDRAGVPFIAGALVPAAILALARRPGLAAPCLATAAFFAFFFRDPERIQPAGAGLVVAPADGRVMHAGPARSGEAPPGSTAWQQITIFLSPLDVHVNRIPAAGRVVRVDYQPGSFLPAYRPESAANEHTEIELDCDGTTVVMRQVVGVLARRIVCRLTPGDEVATGQRFGLMKFGSRMDVFLPHESAPLVAPGDRVRGGETVIARLVRAREASA